MKTLLTILLLVFSYSIVIGQERVVLNQNSYITIANSAYITLDNTNPNALATTGTGGNIISEGENNVLKWIVKASTGNYVVPFTTASLVKIPLQVNITAAGTGTAGAIIFSTYETATDANTAYPSDVTNMNSNCNTGNALDAVDRFWRIDAGSYTTKPAPVINFGYNDAANEIGGTNTITESKLKAERFNSTTGLWETPVKLYGIDNAALNTVSGVTVAPVDFFKSWTLIDTTHMTINIAVLNVSNAIICSGNTSVITPGGGSTYTLQPDNTSGTSFTLSPSTTTTYTISGNNAQGCHSTPATNAITTLTVNSTPTVGIASVSSPTMCSGNTSVITPNGASTYTLIPGNVSGTSFTLSPSVSTSYTISGTSAAGCISNTASVATTTIFINPTPTIGIASVSSSTICSGNTSVITPGGASTYTLIPGNVAGTSFTVTPSVTTSYTINGTSGSGCINKASSAANSTITVTPTPTINFAFSSSNTICSGNTSVITPNGASTYTLMPGNVAGTSFTVNPTATSTYTISGSVGTGTAACQSNASTNATPTVYVNATPVLAITGPGVMCSGTNATLTASTASTYSWSTAATGSIIVVSPATNASYTVTGTNTYTAGNCTAKAVYTISVTPSITPVTTFSYSTPVCLSDVNPVPLSGSGFTGGGTYNGTGGLAVNATNGTIDLAHSLAGVYTVSYTVSSNSLTCTASGNTVATVSLIAIPGITVSPNVTINAGDTTPLTALSTANTYTWFPTAGLSCGTCNNPTASPPVTTTYCVRTASGTCSSSLCVTVLVEYPCANTSLTLPNAFSPNGDGNNDQFCLQGLGCVTAFSMMVFDRWGEKIVELSNTDSCWDGTYHGKLLDPAVFVYWAKATFSGGLTVEKKGNITLIK